MTATPPPPEPMDERIVIIGAHTILGELLIDELTKLETIEKFWVIDLYPPRYPNEKFEFIQHDLIKPGADARIAETFKRIGATTVVHCSLKNNPSLNWMQAHELEVIGTMNQVSAAKAAKVRKFIFCSTTAVYGASPKNPNYIRESQALPARPRAHFIRDKVEAEREVARLYEEAPDMIVTTLRFCLIVGPRSRNYFTELFRRPMVPTLLGYDPLMQFIHETDAKRALLKATLEDYRGVFNIVGQGVIPLGYALRVSGKKQLPLLTQMAYPVVQSLWHLQAISVPGKLLDFFKYLWVADGRKARDKMGFEAKLSSKEAFLSFAKTNKLQEKVWAQ